MSDITSAMLQRAGGGEDSKAQSSGSNLPVGDGMTPPVRLPMEGSSLSIGIGEGSLDAIFASMNQDGGALEGDIMKKGGSSLSINVNAFAEMGHYQTGMGKVSLGEASGLSNNLNIGTPMGKSKEGQSH